MSQDPKMQGTESTTQPTKHTNLIVGLIILAVFIIFGSAFLAWYLLVYSNPNTVTLDSMRQLLSSRNITTSGEIWSRSGDDGIEIQNQVSLTSHVHQADNHITARLQTTMTTEGQTNADALLELELGAIKLSDGQLFLQIGDLMSNFERYLADNDLEIKDLDSLGRVVYELADIIDGEWWQLSLADLLEAFGLDDDAIDSVDGLYNCAMSVAAQDHTSELVQAYVAASFLQATKVGSELTLDSPSSLNADRGNNYYRVTINYEKLAEFANLLLDGKMMDGFEACYRDFQQTMGQEESDDQTFNDSVTAADLQEIIPADLEIYLEISNWSHQLQNMVIRGKNEFTDFGAQLKFQYQTPTIAAPDTYRPMTDFAEELERAITKVGNYNEYYNGVYYIGGYDGLFL